MGMVPVTITILGTLVSATVDIQGTTVGEVNLILLPINIGLLSFFSTLVVYICHLEEYL